MRTAIPVPCSRIGLEYLFIPPVGIVVFETPNETSVYGSCRWKPRTLFEAFLQEYYL